MEKIVKLNEFKMEKCYEKYYECKIASSMEAIPIPMRPKKEKRDIGKEMRLGYMKLLSQQVNT